MMSTRIAMGRSKVPMKDSRGKEGRMPRCSTRGLCELGTRGGAGV